MARVPLLGGFYKLPVLAAAAQRCGNLFPELLPQGSQPPTPVVTRLTPGLEDTFAETTTGMFRGLYRATNGALYGVVESTVYLIDTDFTVYNMGNIDPGTTPVSMMDNGTIVVLVDGTTKGYWWALGTATINPILDAAFYGSNRVCYLDTFFIFHRPGTNQFYLSPADWNGTDPFDATYLASKTMGPDPIISIAVVKSELWLVGQLTPEVWYNAGTLDFPFARQPGVAPAMGMVRGYSLTEIDNSALWVSRNLQGHLMAVRTQGYEVARISNHAIEQEWQTYADVTDIIVMSYQLGGHTFAIWTFPSADKTWAYDLSTGEWHERFWTDPETGAEHRHRASACAFAYEEVFCGDHTTGALYRWSPDAFDDAGDPIIRIRSFPHLVRDGDRLSYSSFIADMDVGDAPETSTETPRDMLLRCSRSRGGDWDNYLPQNWGAAGMYNNSIIWRRLGMARDMVFEVSWSFPHNTACLGAFIEAEQADG